MGRRSRTRGCPRADPWLPDRSAFRGRPRRKQSAPGAPASRSCGQCVCSSPVDRPRRRVPGKAAARSRTAVGGSSGRARAWTPGRLRDPDREVADDRTGRRVQRHAGRGHPPAQLLVHRLRSRASPPRRTAAAATVNSSDREIPSSGPSHGDRPRPAAPRARPRRCTRIEGQHRADDQQHVDRPRGMEERAPRGGDREEEARHEERQDAEHEERPERRHRAPATAGRQAR